MALYGRVGNSTEVHQIGMALFEAGKAEGRSICGVEGNVEVAITITPSCQKCRDRKIKNEMARLMDPNRKARKRCRKAPSVRSL